VDVSESNIKGKEKNMGPKSIKHPHFKLEKTPRDSPLPDDLQVILDPLVVDVVTLSRLERSHLDLVIGERSHGPRSIGTNRLTGETRSVTESRGQHG
jgi:hypothetical protein